MKKYILLGLNIIVFCFTVIGVSYAFIAKKGSDLSATGWEQFRYFTVLSNIGFGLIALYNALTFKKNNKLKQILNLVFTSAVMITFMTVMLFLGQLYGYKGMFTGANFFFHLINPLIALIIYLFSFDNRISPLYNFYSIVPILIYGIIYFTNVLILQKWPDFYAFNTSAAWYISTLIMFFAGLIISFGIYYLNILINYLMNRGSKQNG